MDNTKINYLEISHEKKGKFLEYSRFWAKEYNSNFLSTQDKKEIWLEYTNKIKNDLEVKLNSLSNFKVKVLILNDLDKSFNIDFELFDGIDKDEMTINVISRDQVDREIRVKTTHASVRL
jgi:hypothetical protein